ncbi:anti-sigma-factor antagonist [Candidatus Magnetoovum chiemensis]|nr:anti-sigma-factor antagonist [Candidatus Magnetoovum chiemensis]
MIDFQKKNKKTGLLTLSGDLTIQNSMEIKKAIEDAIDNIEILQIDIEKSESIDLSFLQLICSAKKTLNIKKKQLEFTGLCPQSYTHVVEEAGFSHVLESNYNKEKITK